MSERRYFTLQEANSLVPWLEQCFSRILQLRSQMRSLYSSLEELGHRPASQVLSASPESLAGQKDLLIARGKFIGLMELLQEELHAIAAEGIEVKDLDTGLCDFWSTSVVAGKEVYLCWRYGEKRIAFYHEPHAGFAGRKEIPPEPPSC